MELLLKPGVDILSKRILINPARQGGWSGEWTLAMLVRLRWIAVIAQALLIASVQLMSSSAQPIDATPLWVVTAILAATNLGLEVAARKLSWAHRLIGPSLIVDIVALTALLGLSGGPSNPFSVLYLVHVTLAALTLRGAWLWTIVALAVVGYGALFWWHVPLPASLGGHGMMHHAPPAPSLDPLAAHMHHTPPAPKPASSELAFSAHLQGMWLALTMVAVLIAGFVSRLNAALLRERHARASVARQLSLTTLAAGAAHELATPLSSIKLSAAELRDRLHELEPTTQASLLDELLEDAELIVDEVNRARQVLDRMALGAGELRGEGASTFSMARLSSALMAQLGADASRVELVGQWSALVTWPLEATAQALLQLVRNALDASPSQPVTLSASLERGRVMLVVEDRGEGMSAEVLERVGEPFFTTKATGQGMGLGVFLAYTLVEQLGGQLRIDSSPGHGTRAVLELPQEIS